MYSPVHGEGVSQPEDAVLQSLRWLLRLHHWWVHGEAIQRKWSQFSHRIPRWEVHALHLHLPPPDEQDTQPQVPGTAHWVGGFTKMLSPELQALHWEEQPQHWHGVLRGPILSVEAGVYVILFSCLSRKFCNSFLFFLELKLWRGSWCRYVGKVYTSNLKWKFLLLKGQNDIFFLTKTFMKCMYLFSLNYRTIFIFHVNEISGNVLWK